MGILPNRLFDSVVIAKQGGTLVNVASTDTVGAIYELVDKLNAGLIHGFAVDRWSISWCFGGFVYLVGKNVSWYKKKN